MAVQDKDKLVSLEDLKTAYDDLDGGISDLKNTLSHKADVIYDTASSDIASFPDGADGLPVKDLTVAIEPVQDLHGYDNPWPAGGWKNLLPISIATVKTKNTVGTWSGNTYSVSGLTIKCDTINDYVSAIFISGTASDVVTVILTEDSTSWSNDMLFSSGVDNIDLALLSSGNGAVSVYASKTGAVANAGNYGRIRIRISSGEVTNKTVYPMIRLSTVSDATFAPYSNICPISGWTGANVRRFGINWWDEQWEVGTIDANTGENVGNSGMIRMKNRIRVVPGETYYLHVGSVSGSTNFINGCFFDKYGNWLTKSFTGGYYNSTFVVPSGAYYFRCSFNAAYGATYKNDISINYPSSDHDYHTGGETIPISWQSSAGTVYGGTLDVTSGVLTVDSFRKVLNGTEPYTSWSGEKGYVPGNSSMLSSAENPNCCCTHYNRSNDPSFANLEDFSWLGSGAILYFHDSRISSVEEFQAFLADQNAKGTPVTIVAKLATPLSPIQLDPTTVTTLLGQNNIWADCGPSTVEYPCDTKLYIQKINTPTDDDMIADANIASGQYFIVNNNLYLSTTTILAGDPIKPGTNCTLTNLAAALNAINS